MSKIVKIVKEHFERALVAYQHAAQDGAALRGCLADAIDAYLNPPKPAFGSSGIKRVEITEEQISRLARHIYKHDDLTASHRAYSRSLLEAALTPPEPTCKHCNEPRRMHVAVSSGSVAFLVCSGYMFEASE